MTKAVTTALRNEQSQTQFPSLRRAFLGTTAVNSAGKPSFPCKHAGIRWCSRKSVNQDLKYYGRDEDPTFAHEQNITGLLTVAANVCLSVVQLLIFVVLSRNFQDFIEDISRLPR